MPEAGHEPTCYRDEVSEHGLRFPCFLMFFCQGLDPFSGTQASSARISLCTAPVTRARFSSTYTFTSLRMPNSGR